MKLNLGEDSAHAPEASPKFSFLNLAGTKPFLMKITLLFSLLIFISSASFGQKIELDFTGGVSSSEFFVGRGEGEKLAGNNNLQLGSILTLSVAGKLSDKFYLRTKFGFNQPYASFKFKYYGNEFSGIFSREQIFMAVYPEFRFYPTEGSGESNGQFYTFFNLGPGFYHSIKSSFDSKWRRSPEGKVGWSGDEPEANRDRARFGWGMNFGFCSKVNSVGFRFAVGYLNVVPAAQDHVFPAIGVHQLNIDFGISYTLL